MTDYSFTEIKDPAVFDEFVLKNKGNVFQTYMWSTVKTQWDKHMFMAYDGQTPVCAALCMERTIKAIGRIWYIPLGVVSVCEDISGFVSFLKEQMNNYHIFGICTDPMIPERINNDPVDLKGLDTYTECGFKKINNKNEYLVQPPIDIITTFENKTFDSLFDSFEKGVRHGYKTGVRYGLKQEIYSYDSDGLDKAMDIFFSIISETADRVEFIHRSKDYYLNIMNALKGHCELSLVYISKKSVYEELESLKNEEEKNIKSEVQNKQTKKELDSVRQAIVTCGKVIEEIEGSGITEDKIYLAGGLTSYFGLYSDCLYGGTVNLLRNTLRTSHYLNVERISRSMEKGCIYHSMGRVTGDPYDKDNKLFGLAQYKKSYGGDVYEYVGDLHLTNGTGFKMYLFTSLFPSLRHLKSKLFRKISNKRNKG